MEKHLRNPAVWKVSGALVLYLSVLSLDAVGGLGWLKVGEQAPLFALLGAVGYGVVLIPTRADATGRLFDLAAHTAVVFALVESALAWLEAEESGELAKVLGGVLAVLAVTMLALITWVARP